MKNTLKLKIYHKKLLLTKLSSLRYSQPTLFAVAVLLAGILTVVFYHSLFPTEAATNTVTVTDNNQTITEQQNSSITTLTKTSIVTVKDPAATSGYVLTATLSSTLAGSTATISNANSSECPITAPCTLTTSPTTVLTTNNNNAVATDGETTTFEVKITIPASPNIGNYTLDIAYDETASSAPYIPPDQLTPTNTWVKATDNNTNAISSITGASATDFTVDLDANMIPIVNKADDGTYPASWCNYDEKQWCNAVTVTAATLAQYQADPAGTIIAEDDILGYWTYIPRYKYQVTRYNATNDNTNYRTQTPFNIQFQKATDAKATPTAYTGTGDYQTNVGADNAWATHPAFTVGSTELNGFWYGKFESSRSDNYYCYVYTSGDTCNTGATAEYIGTPLNTTSLYTTIKPNRAPATYQRTSNIYLSAKYIKTAHNLNTQNTHMSNNSHWGATIYLSTSAYGVGDETCADATCSTNFKKVYNNGYNNSGITTNQTCSVTNATGDTSTTATGCRYVTGAGPTADHSDAAGATLYQYHTTIGQQASATGNVYGVYDMAGGVWDYQMAVYANPAGTPMSGTSASQNSGFTVGGGATGKCFASTAPHTTDCTVTNPLALPTASGILQQYDVSTFTNTYTNGDGGAPQGYYGNNNLCTFQTCGGQALHETKTAQSVSGGSQSWGGEYSYFVYSNSPWFIRGGYANNGSYGGLFSSSNTTGHAYNGNGWRAVAGAY